MHRWLVPGGGGTLAALPHTSRDGCSPGCVAWGTLRVPRPCLCWLQGRGGTVPGAAGRSQALAPPPSHSAQHCQLRPDIRASPGTRPPCSGRGRFPRGGRRCFSLDPIKISCPFSALLLPSQLHSRCPRYLPCAGLPSSPGEVIPGCWGRHHSGLGPHGRSGWQGGGSRGQTQGPGQQQRGFRTISSFFGSSERGGLQRSPRAIRGGGRSRGKRESKFNWVQRRLSQASAGSRDILPGIPPVLPGVPAPWQGCSVTAVSASTALRLAETTAVLYRQSRKPGIYRRPCGCLGRRGSVRGFGAARGAGTVWAEPAGPGAVVRRCWPQEEALWSVLWPVLGALCPQVPSSGDPCLGACTAPAVTSFSLVPVKLWEGSPHPHPVPVNPDAAAAQRGWGSPGESSGRGSSGTAMVWKWTARWSGTSLQWGRARRHMVLLPVTLWVPASVLAGARRWVTLRS